MATSTEGTPPTANPSDLKAIKTRFFAADKKDGQSDKMNPTSTLVSSQTKTLEDLQS